MTNVTGTFAACDDASCFQSNLSGQDTSGGTTNNIAVAILSSLLAIVIFIGNGLIIVSVCLVRKLRQPANYLIVSLALSDFLVAVIVLPLTIVYEILQEWVFGNTICNIHISVDVICCATSILNLVMISIDRYVSLGFEYVEVAIYYRTYLWHRRYTSKNFDALHHDISLRIAGIVFTNERDIEMEMEF